MNFEPLHNFHLPRLSVHYVHMSILGTVYSVQCEKLDEMDDLAASETCILLNLSTQTGITYCSSLAPKDPLLHVLTHGTSKWLPLSSLPNTIIFTLIHASMQGKAWQQTNGCTFCSGQRSTNCRGHTTGRQQHVATPSTPVFCSPCFIMTVRNLTMTLDAGLMRTCLLPLFSALLMAIKASLSTFIRTISVNE